MNRLKALRKRLRISQNSLASKMGVSRMTIHRWESGEREPKLGDLIKLRAILGAGVDVLLRFRA